MPERNDQQLITETLEGNLSSFEVLVRFYQKNLYFYILKKVKDDRVAEDVVQEAFVRAFEKLSSFDRERPFKPWLYQIAINITKDYWRKERKIVPLTDDIEDDRSETVIEKMSRREEHKNVREAVKVLPKKYGKVLSGFYFENLSYQELAKRFAMPINTIRTRIKRAKILLEKTINDK